MYAKKRTVEMSGESMEVLFDISCLSESSKSVRLALPIIVRRLSYLLALQDVADFLIHRVRIGDTVVLVDREAGQTFRLEMQAKAVYVLGIYNEIYTDANSSSIVYLVGSTLLHTQPKLQEVA